MKPIICQVCGSNDFKKEDGVFKCKYCNTEYTLEEMKKLMIEGQVELVKGNAEKERLVKNAEQYVKLKEFSLAEKEYLNITHQFPEECRGWLGLFSIEFYKYLSDVSFNYPSLKNLKNALSLSDDNKEVHGFFDSFMSLYGNSPRIIPYKNKTLDSGFNSVQYYTVDDFTKWLLFDALDDLIEVNYEKLTSFLVELSEKYCGATMSGSLVPCNLLLPKCIEHEDWKLSFPAEDPLILKIFDTLGYRIKQDKYHLRIFDRNTKQQINLGYKRTGNFCLIGNWFYLEHFFILLNTRLTKNQVWQIGGYCRHCGASFKGLINKVCSNPNCNKPKDY